VAAEALLPAAALLAPGAGPPAAQQVRQLLWDALLELEDLSPATGSVMTLLAEVHSSPAAAAASGDSSNNGLSQLVPRLWPFLRHGLTSVRHATVRCLSALLRSQPAAELLPGEELQRALRLLFQCLLLERNGEVLAAAQAAWELLVQRAAPDVLAAALPAQSTLAGLFQLAATPAHSCLDASLVLTVPLPRKRAGAGGSSKAQLAARGAASQQQQQQEVHRRESLVVEADGDAAHTTRMRLAAARALGQLAHAVSASSAPQHPAQTLIEQLLRGGSATGRLLASFVVTYWVQLRSDTGDIAAAGQAAAAAHPCLQHLLAVLLEQLAAPAAAAAQSYSELAPLYAQLRSQASGLIARALKANVALAMPGPLEGLGHQGALALAAQVPATAGEQWEAGSGTSHGAAHLLGCRHAFGSMPACQYMCAGG
jgi:TATA-binding protein-associated factor